MTIHFALMKKMILSNANYACLVGKPSTFCDQANFCSQHYDHQFGY